jgi:hypothetical protein
MVVNETHVRCDAPGCDAVLDYTVESAEAAKMIDEGGRTFAYRNGWSSVGDEDYCPSHSE